MDANGATLLLCGPVLTDDGEVPRRIGRPSYLILQSGAIPGAMLRLPRGDSTVGRMADAPLRIAEATISRRHALIRVGADGRAYVVDLESSNGTFLNGRRLEAHVSNPLRDGDRLRFGSHVVAKFSRPDPSEERFQRDMFERTVRDPLTGLYHRVYFLEEVAGIAARGAASGAGLAVLMLDIDHFKRINDEHGHDAGDSVLRQVASVLRGAARVDDLVARYGGEEFVAALPIASVEQALERAERIRSELASRPIAVGGAVVHVTASIGLAFIPHDRTQSAAALLSAADRALYRAKHAGRNRVACASEILGTSPSSLSTVDDEDLF